jgi:Kef-type K+ transport system membrane component KefB
MKKPVNPWIAYGLLVAVALFVISLVQGLGGNLEAPMGQGSAAPHGTARLQSDLLFHVLLALTAVMALGRLMGTLFRRLGQPAVIGETLAGIMLGPSLMGRILPEAGNYLFPGSVAPFLGVIAQIGIVLYMFQVGLELNASEFKGRAKATFVISHASILVPFVLGALLAVWLYPRFSSRDISFISFSLFIGVAMSITAFPVLARILDDTGMSRSSLGVMALSCAAVDDATAWCLLAIVVGVAQSDAGAAVWVGLGLAAFILAMFFGLRPWILKFVGRHKSGPISQSAVALVLLGVLVSALCTEFIGIHAIFGAFLFGVLIPHDSTLALECERKLKDLVAVLFLPAFFAFTGMRTQIGLLQGGQEWLACAGIVLVATLGKFGGASLAARYSGMGWRDSSALGILMNTRGMVELIVLNLGLDLRIISPTLFAMMVLMALATTLATVPALRAFTPGVLPGAKGAA